MEKYGGKELLEARGQWKERERRNTVERKREWEYERSPEKTGTPNMIGEVTRYWYFEFLSL